MVPAPAMQSSAQIVTFPVLDAPALLTDTASIGCPLQPDDLSHPQPARILALYEWWMSRLLQLQAEDIKRAAEAQLDQLEHPEIYREAMYLGVFTIALNQLLIPSGVHDFTVRDLTLPRPDRLRYILSAVINFYFFAEEQGERVLRPLQDEMTELAQEEVALIEENQKLRDRIEEETARRLENQAKMAAYRPEEERNTEMMKAAHRAIDDHGAQKRALKLDCEELRRRLTDLQQENSNIDLAIMDLRGQIISSPEKLRGKIDEMQDQLNREKEMFQETEVKERQTQSKINALTQYSQELNSCIRILDDWSVDVDKLRDAELRLGEHEDHLRNLEAEQSDLKDRIELLERRISNGREELTRMKDKMERKREAAKGRKRDLELQHAASVEEKRHLDDEAFKKNLEAQAVEQHIRDMYASLNTELDKGEKAFKRIKEQITLYSIRLNKALDSINELNALDPEL
ncbi:hypothetical protein BMF94_4476 [Rhodotorula taiwanensis]|uniref:Uncharacterized protein n=1 Tax=Rhodotorula taiwanensis TaxID=741276 RepID=A0A2S5B7A5_9BASI|nr:hypothetical protein BMF94_4476 [Rhodotorula taiwanensis]